MNPSDLPWWGWLLCAIGAVVVGLISMFSSDDKDSGCMGILIAYAAYLAAIVFALIGAIRFIKWVWNS